MLGPRTWALGLVFVLLVSAGPRAARSAQEPAAAAAAPTGVAFRTIDAPPAPPPGAIQVWANSAPEGCPFPPSTTLSGLGFTGRHAEYTNADTWYPSWAADGRLYSPWTDGNVNGTSASSGGELATTGHAVITGDDPLALVVSDQGTFASSPRPYEGRYPCGSLVHNGVWFYGTYCLHPAGQVDRDGIPYNWPWLGPFVGFRWSTDLGKTWTDTPCTPEQPLFGECALEGQPVKIGAPHFVDFGQDMEHSPDGKAYLVAHGAHNATDRRFAFNSWITGDEIYLVRVSPSVESMNNTSYYEFFAGNAPDGRPIWSTDFSQIQPIAQWPDHMGCVTLTYDAPLKKYLMCVTDGGNTVSAYNTSILESDAPTGPYRLAAYLPRFGEQAYFVNIPSKFLSADGRTFWLAYSANFSEGWADAHFHPRPRGSRYGMCLQEVKLLAPGEASIPANPLESSDNLARLARLTPSSTLPGYDDEGLVDGVVAGYPEQAQHEWCTRGEREGATVRLKWNQPVTIDRLWLFDRPNDTDQVQSGLLLFSDGSVIPTGDLPDDAQHGLEVRFPAKTIRWLIFAVTEVKEGTKNVGLAEIAAFKVP